MNRDGSDPRRLTFNDLFERQPVWSPDCSRIAFAGRAADGSWDIYAVHADGEGLARLTNDAARDDDPSWTPDGRQIVYDHGVFTCPCNLRSVNVDGSNDHALNTRDGNSFSPDVAPVGGKSSSPTIGQAATRGAVGSVGRDRHRLLLQRPHVGADRLRARE
jgi:Tol biopolymer transport system component